MQGALKKVLGLGAVVALGIAAPVGLSPGTAAVTVTNACAQEDPELEGGSCKPKTDWDCIIDGILRTHKCRAGDTGC